MPKYVVTVNRETHHTCEMEIEADSEEDATAIFQSACDGESDFNWRSEEFCHCEYEIDCVEEADNE